MAKLKFISLLLVCFALVACSDAGKDDSDPVTPVAGEEFGKHFKYKTYGVDMCHDMYYFSYDILQALCRQSSENSISLNTVYSPFAVDKILCAAANCSDDATADRIVSVRHRHEYDKTIEKWGDYLTDISCQVAELDFFATYNQGDRFWVKPSKTVSSNFADSISKANDADMILGNISGESFSQWYGNIVSVGRVGDFSYDKDAALVISSALEYQGTWMATRESASRQITFHNYDGSDTEVEAFEISDFTSVYVGPDLIYSRFYLGRLHLLMFELFMPVEGKTIDDVLTTIKEPYWSDRCEHYRKRIYMTIPKFEVAFSGLLDSALAECGITFPVVGTQFMPDAPGESMSFVTGASIRLDINGVNQYESSFDYEYYHADYGSMEVVIDRPFVFNLRSATSEVILYQGVVDSLK